MLWLHKIQLGNILYTLVVLVTKSCPTLVTPRTGGHQAPVSMRFPRQEYWSGLPFPSPGDRPGMEPAPPALAGGFLTAEPAGKSRAQVTDQKLGLGVDPSQSLSSLSL